MISVIIPVYNTERFLRRCIDSVLAQSYTDFELILVDDGSNDNSGSICDEYADKDNRIKVLHQDNGGASRARQTGVKASCGEWITFVDSDDTLPIDSLYYYSRHFTDNTDIIIGWLNDCRYEENFLEIEEYRRRNIGRYGIIVGPHTHAYRRNIVTEDVFDMSRDIVMGEDMIMNIRIAFKTEKPVSITHHNVYNYDVTENCNNATNGFKTTIDYEHQYHQLRLDSIPPEYHQMYMKEMIGLRLYELFRYLDTHPMDRTWVKTAFYYELMNDVNRLSYKTNKANMWLLTTKSLFMQYFLIQYKRLRVYLMKQC